MANKAKESNLPLVALNLSIILLVILILSYLYTHNNKSKSKTTPTKENNIHVVTHHSKTPFIMKVGFIDDIM